MSEKVAIIGLGYVGIPLAHAMAEVGIEVLGFDVDANRVAQLKRGESPLRHIGADKITAMLDTGFDATADYSRSAECDYLIICVPTPLNKSREPDLSFVESTMRSLQPHLRAGQMLALESTTWPGTTEEILRPYVEAQGLSVGEDFFLVYSPEREDPGNPDFTTKSIPKIVGGSTPTCLERGCGLYNRFIDTVVPVSSTQAAELVKLLENIHRAINIGLVNELKVVADSMDLDIFEVIDAAKTKPFGFTAYYPGPGIGGHCIPIDPFYLTWKAKEYGVHTRFIELAGEVNEAMPDYVARKVMLALNERGKAVKGARILALGIAYKPDVDDMRESPSVHVMEILRDWGARIEYSDEYVPVFPKMREHNFDLDSVDLTPEAIGSYDAVVVLTNHSSVDYDAVRQHASLIVDSRGVYRDPAPNVFRA